MAMPTKIIVEIGSCHMGKFEYAIEAIDECIEIGADAVKFQLFPNITQYTSSGNVWLDPQLYLDILDYANDCGMEMSASVFDEKSFEFLLALQPTFIKFSYGKKDETALIYETLSAGIEPIVSCDVMTDHQVPELATKLYCISEYPVKYQIDFNELFPRFHGFSDHTLGHQQTLQAVASGAKIIEKHMKLNRLDCNCPDSYFALSPGEMARMIAEIRRLG